MYRVGEVDGTDDEIATEIIELDKLAFGDTAPPLTEDELAQGHWWIVTLDKTPVAYAALKPSARYSLGSGVGYLNRCGVLKEHRGHGLQKRLIRVRERRAKRDGWWCLVTDTTDNIASANSLIKAGYRLYKPVDPWSFGHALYWRKFI